MAGDHLFGVGQVVDIRGDHHRSRMGIAHGHQAIFNSIYKGSTVDLQVRLPASGTRLSTTQFFNEDDPAITELDFAAGERVYVSWVPGWEVVLPHG